MSESPILQEHDRHQRRIRELPNGVAGKIKSSTTITHMRDVIGGLIQNALDAHARTIHVTVDLLRGGCVVEDDGDGIHPADFAEDGGLGKPHRFNGRSGLFLASLACLSLLTITSRQVGHRSTNTLLLHHSKPVARLTPAPDHDHFRSGRHGTKVTMHDLFGNMPVRVKNRALALRRPDELQREWDSLRLRLVSIVLSNDQITKLVVLDADGKNKLMFRPRRLAGRCDDRSIVDDLDLERVGSILSQAGVVAAPQLDSWRLVSAKLHELSIQAAFSLKPSLTRHAQFVSVAGYPIWCSGSTNMIFEEVNRLFSLSDFGSQDRFDSRHSTHSPVRGGVRDSSSAPVAKSNRSWPVFYIRIYPSERSTLREEGGELTPESGTFITRILAVLDTMISAFLTQHGFKCGTAKRKRVHDESIRERVTGEEKTRVPLRSLIRSGNARVSKSGDAGCASTGTLDDCVKLPLFRRSTATMTFDNWSRTKFAKEETLATKRPIKQRRATNTATRPATTQIPVENGVPGSVFIGEKSPVGVNITHNSVSDAAIEPCASEGEGPADEFGCWTFPDTADVVGVNLRTEHSNIIQSNICEGLKQPTAGEPSSGIIGRARKTRQGGPTNPPDGLTQTPWLDRLLKEWDNPAFARSERVISTIDPGACQTACTNGWAVASLGGMRNLEYLEKFRGTISKSDLARAQVIAQVDQKYILVKLVCASGNQPEDADQRTTLALIDQHAANERCRVEQLLESLFTAGPRAEEDVPFKVATTNLEPINIKVAATEVHLFAKHSRFFSIWGVNYDTVRQTPSSDAHISVTTLPVLIAERCRLDPALILDILRSEIGKREDSGIGRSATHTQSRTLERQPPAWVHWVSNCPQGILDLLNSRACRSSVMFNDKLTLDECRELVSRLAKCAFPFQCAHGRPSMIPLLDLRSGSDCEGGSYRLVGKQGPRSEHIGQGDVSSSDFMDAYKSWVNG